MTSNAPFLGRNVYYSGSLTGMPESDLQFPKQLVAYIEKGGASVLQPHAAISPNLPGERDAYFAKLGHRYDLKLETWNAMPADEQDKFRYNYFIALLDKATHMVCLLNSVSTGVGMEIEHAVLKPKMGLHETPILGLVHKDKRAIISPMVLGAAQAYDQFELKTYGTLKDAQSLIHEFLIGR